MHLFGGYFNQVFSRFARETSSPRRQDRRRDLNTSLEGWRPDRRVDLICHEKPWTRGEVDLSTLEVPNNDDLQPRCDGLQPKKLFQQQIFRPGRRETLSRSEFGSKRLLGSPFADQILSL